MKDGEIRCFVLDDGSGNGTFDIYTYDNQGDLWWCGCDARSQDLLNGADRRAIQRHGGPSMIHHTHGVFRAKAEAFKLMNFLLKWDITESYDSSGTNIRRSWMSPKVAYGCDISLCNQTSQDAMDWWTSVWGNGNDLGQPMAPPAPVLVEAASSEPPKCTCEIMTLMAHGCRCGGV